MKALIIVNGQILTDEELAHLNTKNVGGFERISHNAFLFKLSESSQLLADLQHALKSLSRSYKIFYFAEDPVLFSSN